MDLDKLSRRELQALAKENGIKANMKVPTAAYHLVCVGDYKNV